MKVVVPTQLRGYTAGRAEVDAAGATLNDVLVDLDRQFPGFRFRVIDEQDRVRRHIILFVGGERVEDLSMTIPAGAELQIIGALSGG
ncbi:MAG TPA: MoaD/ThiS family protein [Kofleriaceae bacterium]|nr:MoaD/ThiS family protein [Kofleriaceae bacterium]